MENYQVLRTDDSQKRAQFYAQADAQALLGSRQFVAGFLQHPETSLYQVWLSTTGFDLIYVSTHRLIADAESDVQAIKSVLSTQAFYDETALATLFQKLEAESDEKPRPLPDDLVKKISQTIRKSLAHML